MNHKPLKQNTTTAITAGALLFREFEALRDILIVNEYRSLLDEEVMGNQYLKIKSQAARKRIVTEIKRRIAAADLSFWKNWVRFSSEEKRLALLYVVLKAYPIAFDLHFEVTFPKWKAKQHLIEVFDYQMRLDELASHGNVVESWTVATRRKTITHYMTVLREAGIMKGSTLRLPAGIGNDFWQYMARAASPWFFEACLMSKKEREKYL